MAFLDLSLELRNVIYHEILCPPQAVNLHIDWKRCSREWEHAALNGDCNNGEDTVEDEEGGYDEEDNSE